ncbi:hypothetical protein CW731_03530 [Polaribacter sp. ALD11]|uniref:DUF1796 family putative cysteine peptidase n=1 Tax=Polaribacter sp. ALD11 TaxID=2058137 RepID=UPI000C30C80F|nr:DUF1796 family putative cysteine peptidase [Polaribacter sp. ALD11]AUC84426.1 hypothetical protein CW731_03530 [Polaribacter sp. ALD11]
MKIKLKITKKHCYDIILNKRWKSLKTIIPIGCDCHPAHMLEILNLRKQSLPFDWLDTEPIYSIKYAYENIVNKFNFFLRDLKEDNEGKVFSNKFKYSIFYHYDDLIINKKLQVKIQNRCINFIKLIKTKPIYFLNTVTSESINSNEKVKFFLNSVLEFQNILKRKDILIIYLRYDETQDENKLFCDKLIDELEFFDKNIRIIKYIREKKLFGIWGDEKKYTAFIRKIGISIYPIFPKIIIKKHKIN